MHVPVLRRGKRDSSPLTCLAGVQCAVHGALNVCLRALVVPDPELIHVAPQLPRYTARFVRRGVTTDEPEHQEDSINAASKQASPRQFGHAVSFAHMSVKSDVPYGSLLRRSWQKTDRS